MQQSLFKMHSVWPPPDRFLIVSFGLLATVQLILDSVRHQSRRATVILQSCYTPIGQKPIHPGLKECPIRPIFSESK
jgi:hypothetical protein